MLSCSAISRFSVRSPGSTGRHAGTARRVATRRHRSRAGAAKGQTHPRNGRLPDGGHIRQAYRVRRFLRRATCGYGGNRCSDSVQPSSKRAAPDARSRSPHVAPTASGRRPARYLRRVCGRGPVGKPGHTTYRNVPEKLPKIGRVNIQVLHLFKSGGSGRPQLSESVFKYSDFSE